MIKRNILFCGIIFFANLMPAQQSVPVFVSGTNGYKTFRIPAIINLPNGDLLAFAEGRIQGSSDFGNIDIVFKRSTDKGKTWSALKIVADHDTLQTGNPAPVLDLSDPAFPTGRIFLFYNTGTVNESDIRKGKGYKRVWYKTSINNGESWSDAVEISTQVHLQNKPHINLLWNFAEDWRYYANTPGHAMQFETGRYKGRIFVAANHSAGEIQPQFMDYRAHGFYTDDHGKTFRLSTAVAMPGSNESMAAELSGGRLMMNSRNQRGDTKARIVSISSDGGSTWDTTYFDRQLIDPVCQASILTIGKKKRKNSIAFCNAADDKRRDNLTLRISYDDGITWKKTIHIDKAPENYKGDYTAYSDIVKTGRHSIGVLYEKNGYREIVFKTVHFKKQK